LVWVASSAVFHIYYAVGDSADLAHILSQVERGGRMAGLEVTAGTIEDIDLHFGFHCLTYFRVPHNSEGRSMFAALNTTHYVFIYAYFEGAKSLRSLLGCNGCVQLVISIRIEVQLLYFRYADEVLI
jgi:hypothetical protein